MKKEENKGILILAICGTIAIALMVGCIFFPDEIFGIFTK